MSVRWWRDVERRKKRGGPQIGGGLATSTHPARGSGLLRRSMREADSRDGIKGRRANTFGTTILPQRLETRAPGCSCEGTRHRDLGDAHGDVSAPRR